MSRPDGGPAFPLEHSQAHNVALGVVGPRETDPDEATRERRYLAAYNRIASGMTMRDYFAAKALPLAAVNITPLAPRFGAPGAKLDDWLGTLSFAAYAIADAMLAERAK